LSRQLGRLRSYNKTDHLAIIATEDGGEAEIRFRSCDKPDTLRGPNVSDIWIDEASLITQEDYANVCACGGREGGDELTVLMTFTPQGKQHYTYTEFFHESSDEDGQPVPREGAELFHAHSSENIFLPENWVDQQSRLYTSNLRRQEMGGEFVELQGLLFQRWWFHKVKAHEVPHPKKLDPCIYWDKAATHGSGCYTAALLGAFDEDGWFYCLREIRGQWSPDERNKVMYMAAVACSRIFDNRCVNAVEQEGGSGGVESALATIKLLAGFSTHVDKVTGNSYRVQGKERLPGQAKVIRANGVASYAENGLVRIVTDYQIPGFPDSSLEGEDRDWTNRWLDEICLFPEYKHMDRVDALSGCFNVLSTRRWSTGPGAQAMAEISARRESMQTDDPKVSGVMIERTRTSSASRYGVRFKR
jgi:phage terminase large subunit-like protein